MSSLPSNLTHELYVSLDEGHLCPSCQEGRMERNDSNRLQCLTCEVELTATSRRWRARYPSVPKAPGYNVFASLAKLDGNNGVWVEFAADVDTGREEDARQVYDRLVDVMGPVVAMYSSGSKGYHIQVPFGTWAYDNPKWPAVFVQLAEHLDIAGLIDRSIYQPRGMLRVPDSTNPKTGRCKELLVSPVLTSLSPNFAKLLSSLEETTKQQTSHDENLKASDSFELLKSFTPSCIEKLWLHGLPSAGTRHAAYLHLLSYHYRRGDTLEETLSSMRAFAESYSDNTDMPEHRRVAEAERLTISAYRNGLGFACSRAQEITLCEASCPLFK